jgi:short-subunit dehydrogenase
LKKDFHVLIVCPGWTATNIRKSGTLTKNGSWQPETTRDESKGMAPEQVAKYIADAVVKKKHRIILSKEGKTLVFLNKFFPKLTDRMIYNHLAKESDSPFK